ncbi:hypothetical protein [Streptomyces sp. NPDC056730]
MGPPLREQPKLTATLTTVMRHPEAKAIDEAPGLFQVAIWVVLGASD